MKAQERIERAQRVGFLTTRVTTTGGEDSLERQWRATCKRLGWPTIVLRSRWGRGELVVEMRTAGRALTNEELATLDDKAERLSQHRSAPRMGGPAGQLDPSGARFARLGWEQAQELAGFVVEALGVTVQEREGVA
ncbi:MAG: hypothetical protein HY329_06940 [Chloroflexi bacterium]|nr:hypothetical protein [Chloroflexota bacterium]